MNDIRDENLLSVRDAIDWLERISGHRFGRSTVYLWMNRGVDGRVLETVHIGGRRFTSSEALTRWITPVRADGTDGTDGTDGESMCRYGTSGRESRR